MEEVSTKAHETRKKRNLVHTKLCLNQSVKVNDETYKTVIRYLWDVLKNANLFECCDGQRLGYG